jgi:competence protein ComEA
LICVALSVSPLITIARRGWVLRDDAPRPPRFERLRLDPNIAAVGLMPVLPGVGPVLASRIDAERRRMPFRDADDLIRVHGIGPVILESIRPHLRFGPTPRTSPEHEP